MQGLGDHKPAQPGQEREDQEYLELIIFLSIPCFVWGIWVCWPKIVMDHGRLEPWKIAIQWTGDACAVFWFFAFVIRRFVLGRPWKGREVSSRAAKRFVWTTSGSLLLGMAFSVGMDFYQDYEEELAFQTAAVVEGTILAVSRETVTKQGTVYKLTCQFSDSRGWGYILTIPVFDRVPGGFGPKASPATAQAVRSQSLPSAVWLSYDPAWPRRFWLRDIGPDTESFLEGGYSGLNKAVKILQALPLVFMVLLLHQKIRGGVIPWWYQVPSFVPFMIEAVALAVFGPMFRWGRCG